MNKFFEALGEVWRDLALIEFLMRCALAQKKGEVSKFPLPPYQKGREYENYPTSFSPRYFSDVAAEFNREFPNLAIPSELIELRNAMAHGLIAEVGNSGVDELIKFKEVKGLLKVEFSMTLEEPRLQQIRQSLKELRRYIAKEATDQV